MTLMARMALHLRYSYNLILRRRSFFTLIRRLPAGAAVLDVGCGNNSPFVYKSLRPDIYYVGVDVGDYHQSSSHLADEYHLFSETSFACDLATIGRKFDLVVSSHNLEHADDRDATLCAMVGLVRPGGLIYLAFPTEYSTTFPSRSRTLNYFDDPTHKGLPPDFDQVTSTLVRGGFSILVSERSYKPWLLSILGRMQEPLARRNSTIYQGTWAYYGFEAIIWARAGQQQSK